MWPLSYTEDHFPTYDVALQNFIKASSAGMLRGIFSYYEPVLIYPHCWSWMFGYGHQFRTFSNLLKIRCPNKIFDNIYGHSYYFSKSYYFSASMFKLPVILDWLLCKIYNCKKAGAYPRGGLDIIYSNKNNMKFIYFRNKCQNMPN